MDSVIASQDRPGGCLEASRNLLFVRYQFRTQIMVSAQRGNALLSLSKDATVLNPKEGIMPATRISSKDHRVLKNLAARTGKRHHEIIHEALDNYQRDELLDAINSAFERLRANKMSWAEEIAERVL